MNTSSPNIIFGLANHPRPKNSGYFYYKPPTRLGNFQIKTLTVLDLSIIDEKYLTDILTKGINNLLKEKKYKDDMEYYLTNYETENMKPFTVNILQQVIDVKLKNFTPQ
ncbi:MAG: hypothetical protein PF503_17520 [Desulfobacula sp.]|jgi:hypothetical protein|nr:hypothetical protein [Desulfobacula sp.]